MPWLYPRDLFTQLIEERGLEIVPSAREALLQLVDTVFFTSLMMGEGATRLILRHLRGPSTPPRSAAR